MLKRSILDVIKSLDGDKGGSDESVARDFIKGILEKATEDENPSNKGRIDSDQLPKPMTFHSCVLPPLPEDINCPDICDAKAYDLIGSQAKTGAAVLAMGLEPLKDLRERTDIKRSAYADIEGVLNVAEMTGVVYAKFAIWYYKEVLDEVILAWNQNNPIIPDSVPLLVDAVTTLATMYDGKATGHMTRAASIATRLIADNIGVIGADSPSLMRLYALALSDMTCWVMSGESSGMALIVWERYIQMKNPAYTLESISSDSEWLGFIKEMRKDAMEALAKKATKQN